MLDVIFALSVITTPLDLEADFALERNVPAVTSLPVDLHHTPPPAVSARGVYVFDLDSATILMAKDEHEPYTLASLTKIMTSFVADSRLSADAEIPIGMDTREGNVTYTRMIGLPVGGVFRMRDILAATLITSAGDAAKALAKATSGSEAEFVEEMNRTAHELDLTRMNFVDSYGMGDGNLGSAENVTRLAIYAWRRPHLREMMSRRNLNFCMLGSKMCFNVNTTNLLLGQKGILGAKTGTTDTAGECLVLFYQTERGRNLVLTLLGSADRFSDARKILTWLNTNFQI